MPPQDVHVFGFSESKWLMGPLARQLACSGSCCGTNTRCIFDRRWSRDRNTQFLTQCSQELSYRTVACRAGGTLRYQWMSDARPPNASFTKALENAHALGRQQVVLYSLGPHFFAQFPGHSSQFYDQDMVLPQSWRDAFDSEVDQLMAKLATLRDVACVVWKTNNLGYRHPEHYTRQPHPSVQGGINDVLGQRAVAMAAKHGLFISDVSEVTVAFSKARHNFSSASVDFYHSYDNEQIATALLRNVREQCGTQYRDPDRKQPSAVHAQGSHRRPGLSSPKVVRMAIVFTGRLVASTLQYGCASVHAARLQSFRLLPTQHELKTISVRWRADVGLPNETGLFDTALVVTPPARLQCDTALVVTTRLWWQHGSAPPDESLVSGGTILCHQLKGLWALERGVRVADEWGADWLFRVRIDAIVTEWQMPSEWWETRSCVYVFRQGWGMPSDNVVLSPIALARHMYAESRGLNGTGEGGIVAGASTLGMDLCWLRASIWLIKPNKTDPDTEPGGSRGVRYWSTVRRPVKNQSAWKEAAVSFDARVSFEARAFAKHWQHTDPSIRAPLINGRPDGCGSTTLMVVDPQP